VFVATEDGYRSGRNSVSEYIKVSAGRTSRDQRFTPVACLLGRRIKVKKEIKML